MFELQKDRILILDYGSQYTQLIARRVREIGVYSELYSWDVNPEKIKDFSPKAIILSGSPESTTKMNSPTIPQIVFDLGVPVLGICYGMQSMSVHFNGEVQSSNIKEFGHANVSITNKNSPLFAGIDEVEAQGEMNVWMSHGDKVTQAPSGFEVIAYTSSCPIAAIQNIEKKYYGLQFHPEVTHTVNGDKLFRNFVLNIAGCSPVWTCENIIEDTVKKLKDQIGDEKVILGLSGGVDSSVAALLLHKAIGKNLKCVFIDNGLLRLNEAQQVMDMFEGKFGLNVLKVDAENNFLSVLKGVDEPEAKRKIIGRIFAEIFEDEATKDLEVKWLGQGTIYTDVIESAASETGKAHVIKSHHNVGGLPKEFSLKVVEPLRMLFKDEVKNLGIALGLPKEMLLRHPFPGPGLGVRVLGEVTKDACDLLRKADAIFIEELHKADYYYKVSQAFTVLLPCKSVGVMGDGRKYEKVIAIRAIETIDFMTAHWVHLPYDLLGNISNRIINELDGVSRVVYDISGKPPATIEWE